MAIGPRNSGNMTAEDKRKKKSDAEQDVFMREVDEALRGDQLQDFWLRYGRWVLGVVAVALLAFAAYLFYKHEQTQAAGVAGEQYMTAIDALNAQNLDGAKKALDPSLEADQPGYRAAAQMLNAGIAAGQNDPEKAADEYAKVVADDSLPQAYRDAALIRQTAAQYDSLKPETVIARLKPLAVPENAWFGSAGEMVAIAHIRMDKPKLAGALFAQISKDEGVPQTIRDRTRQMAGLYGVDAVEEDKVTVRQVTPATPGNAGGDTAPVTPGPNQGN